MEITWYGHACFRIREKGVTVVTDPYSRDIGYTVPRIRADVVTISHAHEGHSQPRGIRGSPHIVRHPGEYEIGGVFITGVPTFHDQEKGRERGQNIAFLYDFDRLTVCHLGDLGHVLSQNQVEALNGVSVLLIPVGGGSTLSVASAAEVVGLLEPSIVIPMHYKLPGLSRSLKPVTQFLKAMGAGSSAPEETLRVRHGTLPDEMRTTVLACRAQASIPGRSLPPGQGR